MKYVEYTLIGCLRVPHVPAATRKVYCHGRFDLLFEPVYNLAACQKELQADFVLGIAFMGMLVGIVHSAW